MKDIHNHLLYGIDDGSESLVESIKLLKAIKKEGITEIVFTPHYIIGSSYNNNAKKNKELLKALSKKTSIKLYLGNEVFIDNDVVSYIEKGEISTINDSRYLLVEFPLNEKLDIGKVLIGNLIRNGIVPIIAHPERYHYYKLKDFEDFINEGCLLQGNITSLIDKYGVKSRKNLELLLKKDMIHVMGTDTHRSVLDIKKCEDYLEKVVSKERKEELLNTNFDIIVKDKEFNIYEIKELKGIERFKNIK